MNIWPFKNRWRGCIAFCGLVSALLGLAACGPSPVAVQQTVEAGMAQTQAAIPTQTLTPSPTSVPLSEVDLEAILILPGDLPTDFVGGQIKSKVTNEFKDVPDAAQVVQQGFRAGDYSADGITILLYESPSDIDAAYKVFLREERRLGPLSDVGEKAKIFSSGLDVKSVQILFVRCHAIVFIDLFATSASADVATTYAQRLDKRLTPLVCP
jgi:hypothetical protein